MKAFLMNFARGFMYLCFIIGVLAFISAIFYLLSSPDMVEINTKNQENIFFQNIFGDGFLLSMLRDGFSLRMTIFILFVLLGFGARGILERFDY